MVVMSGKKDRFIVRMAFEARHTDFEANQILETSDRDPQMLELTGEWLDLVRYGAHAADEENVNMRNRCETDAAIAKKISGDYRVLNAIIEVLQDLAEAGATRSQSVANTMRQSFAKWHPELSEEVTEKVVESLRAGV